ncbi:diacylglycerol/lipid kinase family protein [Acidipropionibacterium virtanenii]|uniref:Diacylglycerol kinase n=1 Tax=Acidipropionibacterium virtanenii TaxID=2057246 RepID=A0A344UUF1_9ACTN|nr:diacylglycerol kinase family protein [Acidipropionibacterium virtanenii]AXE38899.1 Diacylglycerol kinase [Acidipropionibacterium virtanenii]
MSGPRNPVIVYNPLKVSDPAKLARRGAEICREAGWGGPVWSPTTSEDHGAGMTARAVSDGADLVCALGGDGTVREVAGALARTGIPLGVLGLGTGNLLARNLGLPHNDFDASLAAVLNGSARPIDLGRVRFDDGPEYCFTVITGMGLDAELMAGAEPRLKARLGWPAYLLGATRALAQRGFGTRVVVDGRRPFSGRSRMVLVCNCGLLPGGIDLVPEARVDDGELDMMAFSPRGVAGWAAATLRAVTLHRRGHRIIRHSGCHTGLVTTSFPVPAEVDGDPVGSATTMRIRVDQGALMVRA